MVEGLWSVTADLLFSPMRRRESVCVCVCVCVCTEPAQSISAYPFLSPLLFCSHCPDAPGSFSLFSPSVWPLSHSLLTYLSPSHPTVSHFLFIYLFFLYFPQPLLFPLGPFTQTWPVFSSCFSLCALYPISSTTLQPLPIICLLPYLFFFSFKRSFGFQSFLFAISLISTHWTFSFHFFSFFFFFFIRESGTRCVFELCISFLSFGSISLSLSFNHSKVHLQSRTWGICAFKPPSHTHAHTHTHTRMHAHV